MVASHPSSNKYSLSCECWERFNCLEEDFRMFYSKIVPPNTNSTESPPNSLVAIFPESKKQYNSAFEQSAEHRLGRGYFTIFPFFFFNFKFDQLRINSKHEDSAGKQSYLITLKYCKRNCFDSICILKGAYHFHSDDLDHLVSLLPDGID